MVAPTMRDDMHSAMEEDDGSTEPAGVVGARTSTKAS